MRRTVPPSAEIQVEIDKLLGRGLVDDPQKMLSELVRLEREGRRVALDGGQTLRGTAIAVPADFSSAAFFIVAACLAASPSLTLTNVGVNPTRTGLIELLRRMGADIRVQARSAAGSPGGEPGSCWPGRRPTSSGACRGTGRRAARRE